MKTFKDLKAGDTIYCYYISFLSADRENKPLFYEGLYRNATERKIIKVDDENIYWYNHNGELNSIPRYDNSVTVAKDKCLDYCIYPISTYDICKVSRELKEKLLIEWNAVIHNRMKQYMENLCNRIYNELGIINSYGIEEHAVIKYIERERVVEVEKFVPICDKFKNYNI